MAENDKVPTTFLEMLESEERELLNIITVARAKAALCRATMADKAQPEKIRGVARILFQMLSNTAREKAEALEHTQRMIADYVLPPAAQLKLPVVALDKYVPGNQFGSATEYQTFLNNDPAGQQIKQNLDLWQEAEKARNKEGKF